MLWGRARRDGARQGPLGGERPDRGHRRALVGDARAVVMDEPTSSLTDREARQLFRIIDDLTSDGVGVVYISHRLDEIFRDIRPHHRAARWAPHRDRARFRARCRGAGAPHGRAAPNELFYRHPHDPGEVALEVRGLARAGEFEGVDLTLRRGEILGLAGLVGAGRTELAQAIFGIRAPEEGEILVHGEEIRIHSPQAAMERGSSTCPRSGARRV